MKVLLPVEEIELVEKGALTAARLLGADRIELVLLRVVTLEGVDWLAGEAIAPAERAEASSYLRPALNRLSELGLKATAASITGDPATEIVQYATSNGCDLIAMCTHAQSAHARLLSQSISASVAQTSPIPVLVVHHP